MPADYQLTATDSVIRTIDRAVIPPDPINADWIGYQAWLDGGGVPDPYIRPINFAPLKIRTAAEILGVAKEG